MAHEATLKQIEELGVLLVVRAENASDAIKGIEAVVKGGIKAVEITFSVPGAPDVIREVGREFGETLLLGAGTVMTVQQANEAAEAGARYLIAPNTDERVINEAKKLNVPVFPGAFTPTEVARAWDLGADAVKIFPASVGGPAYLKALKAPLSNIRMVPTGGVNEKTVGDFFKAGAFAVGAGGALFDNKLIQTGDFKTMTDTAARFMAALRACKE